MSKTPAQIMVDALRRKQAQEAERDARLNELKAKEMELNLRLELTPVDLPAMDRDASSVETDIPDMPKVPGAWRKPPGKGQKS